MLFHEIYGSYYQTVGEVLREACGGTLTKKRLYELVQAHAFGESFLSIPDGLTGERYGDFWIEVESGVCMLHLRTETTMDSEKREALLSAASDGVNDAAKGLMGWVRDLFDRGADADVAALSASVAPYDSTAIGNVFDWSLTQFRESVAMSRKSSPKAEEVWDQLEKSVVAHVADEVKVSIRGRVVELILYKNLLMQ